MKKKLLCTSETFILTYNTYIPLYFWCRAKAFSLNMSLLLGVSLLLFVYNKPIMYHLLFESLWLAHLFWRNLFFVFHGYFIVINNKIKHMQLQAFKYFKNWNKIWLLKSIYFSILFFLAMLCGKQDLSSSTRDWTQAPGSWSADSYHWTAREVPKQSLW